MTIHIGVLLGDPRLPYAYAPGGVFGEEELKAVDNLRRALDTLEGFRFTYFDDHAVLIDALREQKPDLVLNLCDTGFRNEWERELDLPALLQLLDIPYTGAGPTGIVLSNDKALMSAAARMSGVLVPEQQVVDAAREPLELPSSYPAFIKPNVSAGSFGITEKSLVRNDEEARSYLRWIAPQIQATEVLIQEFLPGAEYTVGLIGTPGAGFEVLPPLEIDFGALDEGLPPILTHGSKADPDSPYWSQLSFRRAELPPEKLERLGADCARVFERLDFRDYARFDFRDGEDGRPRLLDANINPTWYEGGKLSLMAGWAGHDYATMMRMILEAALTRAGISA